MECGPFHGACVLILRDHAWIIPFCLHMEHTTSSQHHVLGRHHSLGQPCPCHTWCNNGAGARRKFAVAVMLTTTTFLIFVVTFADRGFLNCMQTPIILSYYWENKKLHKTEKINNSCITSLLLLLRNPAAVAFDASVVGCVHSNKFVVAALTRVLLQSDAQAARWQQQSVRRLLGVNSRAERGGQCCWKVSAVVRA